MRTMHHFQNVSYKLKNDEKWHRVSHCFEVFNMTKYYIKLKSNAKSLNRKKLNNSEQA